MRKLNQRQEKFVINYFKSGNATEAALSAGYSARTAGVIGHNQLKKANVQKRLQDLNEKAVNEKIMSVTERKEILTQIGRFGGKTAVTAIAELNKMDGSYAPIKTDVTSAGQQLQPTQVYNIINPETRILMEKLESGGRPSLELNGNLSPELKQLLEPAHTAQP